MEGNGKNARGAAGKVMLFLAVTHPLEAAAAACMAAKRGRRPLPWALATLAFGVFALRRLRKLPALQGDARAG